MFHRRFATYRQVTPNLKIVSGYLDRFAYQLMNIVDTEIRFAQDNDHVNWALVDYNTHARTALIAHRDGQWFVITCPPARSEMDNEWFETDSYEKAISLFDIHCQDMIKQLFG